MMQACADYLGRAPLRDAQGVDGSDAFPDEDT